jgi:hypothetical protein
MSLKDLLPGGARRTPKRGRPGEDVKRVSIPKATHALLYTYAKDHGMTFGDAAAKLIRDSILDFIGEGPTPGINALHLDRERKQVKVPKGTHAALMLFASDRSMTIGDAAALFIEVSLMKHDHLDVDTTTRQRSDAREQRLRTVGEALARAEQKERQERDNPGHGSGDR